MLIEPCGFQSWHPCLDPPSRHFHSRFPSHVWFTRGKTELLLTPPGSEWLKISSPVPGSASPKRLALAEFHRRNHGGHREELSHHLWIQCLVWLGFLGFQEADPGWILKKMVEFISSRFSLWMLRIWCLEFCFASEISPLWSPSGFVLAFSQLLKGLERS